MLQFKEWKDGLEKNTSSSYVQHESPKTVNNKRHTYFYCHRSGGKSTNVASEDNRQSARATKSQGY